MSQQEQYMMDALQLAMENVRDRHTWPFGAVLVKDGEVVARAVNEVDATCDPTAHAEMQALRTAARVLGTTDLTGAEVFASGYPCPMCLTAMYLAGVTQVYYAYSNEDGAPFDLSAEKGYLELARPVDARHMKLRSLPVRLSGQDVYETWRDYLTTVKNNKGASIRFLSP